MYSRVWMRDRPMFIKRTVKKCINGRVWPKTEEKVEKKESTNLN